MDQNGNHPQGKFQIRGWKTERHTDLPIITDRQIQEGRSEAFKAGLGTAGVVGLLLSLIGVIVALMSR